MLTRVRSFVAVGSSAVLLVGGVTFAAVSVSAGGPDPENRTVTVNSDPKAGVPVSVTLSPNARRLVIDVDWNDKLDARPGRDRYVVRVMAGSQEIVHKVWKGNRPDQQTITLRLTQAKAKTLRKARKNGDAIVAVTQQSDSGADGDKLYERNYGTVLEIPSLNRHAVRADDPTPTPVPTVTATLIPAPIPTEPGPVIPTPAPAVTASLIPTVTVTASLIPMATTISDCSATQIKPNADLTGCHLNGLDLLGADLTNVNLTKATLPNANLIKAILTNVTWTSATCPSGDMAAGSPVVNCDAPAPTTATGKPGWDLVFWTPSNAGNRFDWNLAGITVSQMIVAPANTWQPNYPKTAGGPCQPWGGMGDPARVANSALYEWINSGHEAKDFQIWMRGRDKESTGGPYLPDQTQINQFDVCVAKPFPGKLDFSKINNGAGPKATGVLCILDANSGNTCDDPVPSAYQYGVMDGPTMMGTDPSFPKSAVRASAQYHFGEMYEPGLYGGHMTKPSPGIAIGCPSTNQFGASVSFYIDAYTNSRGPAAMNNAPTLGANGADCPVDPAQLGVVLNDMGSKFYHQVSLWSSSCKLPLFSPTGKLLPPCP